MSMLEVTTVTLVLNFVGGLVKKYVPEAYRGAVVHGAIFIGALGYVYYQNPTMPNGNIVSNAVGYLALSIATYEVVLKRLGNKVELLGRVF